MRTSSLLCHFFALTLLGTAVSAWADTKQDLPVRKPDEDVNSADVRTRSSLRPSKDLLFNGWGVTPAGEHVACGDIALKMVIAPDKKAVLAVCAGYNQVGVNVVHLDAQRQTEFIKLKEAFNGLAFAPDGKKFYVSGGDSGVIHVFNYADGQAKLDQHVKLEHGESPVFLAGICVHPATGKLYVCNEANHEIWVIQPETVGSGSDIAQGSKTMRIEKTIPVGQHPHSCVLGGDQQHLYVSNWGSRSVSIIDTEKGRRLRDLAVGSRPNDMALAPDGRLFVACSGSNMVHVIGTKKLESLTSDASPTERMTETAREVISTSLYPQSPEGSTPCGVAISPDGKTLFVVNADNNDLMVVDISSQMTEEALERGDAISMVEGFIPTGWYPSAVAVSPDNQFVLVANGKGLASRASWPSQTKPSTKKQKQKRKQQTIPFDHPGMTFQGSISFIAKPDAQQMAAYTAQVRRNSPFHPEQFSQAPLSQSPLPSNTIIPSKVGDPCPIKYVLYIIKENRTYDQILGDIRDAQGNPIGNSDPKLTMYGENVTPNQHQLARDYVLLDNLYCNSEVSVDGHSWADAAIATDFIQRSWIISYSKHGKLPGNEEMITPANGYLWDLCRRHGLSYRNYGEGASRIPSANRGRWGKNFVVRDPDRVQFWIDDLHAAEKSGSELPRFTIMSLGEDHTQATAPGAYTPEACVGSNDLGVGRIVEAATHSKFWKDMAIFIIEDDAQNGPDHLDAHRTMGQVLSPYTYHGGVNSTLYTTASMVRTIELILGLPPMTQYDASATPMYACFQKDAQLTPYTARMPKVDLMAKNTSKSPLAEQSQRMNFSDYDLAPEDALNRILWRVAKGPDVPYPAPIHRVLFTKPVD